MDLQEPAPGHRKRLKRGWWPQHPRRRARRSGEGPKHTESLDCASGPYPCRRDPVRRGGLPLKPSEPPRSLRAFAFSPSDFAFSPSGFAICHLRLAISHSAASETRYNGARLPGALTRGLVSGTDPSLFNPDPPFFDPDPPFFDPNPPSAASAPLCICAYLFPISSSIPPGSGGRRASLARAKKTCTESQKKSKVLADDRHAAARCG